MHSHSFDTKKLMTPGPVPLPKEVKAILANKECHHRSKEFQEVLQQVFPKLQSLFVTDQHCYLLSCTGTGGLEALLVNTLSDSKPALFINGGKFGERWGKIAQAYQMNFEEIHVEWGRDVDLNRIEEALKTGRYQALGWQACETSTGALLPTRELAQICRRYGVLSLVDGITALGAARLPMDEWGLDAVVGGSQKAFMLPTGMCFVALSERAEKAEVGRPRYYFDLKTEKKSNLSGKTRYSTPIQMVLALDWVLDHILEKGLESHLDEIEKRAQVFRDAVSLSLFPETASPSLSCLQLPESASGSRIKEQVYEKGFMIVAGQDQLKDRVLRVGHMGDMSLEDLKATAQAIESCL